MKYTQVPANTFKQLQLNAGILTTSFDPATGTIGDIIGATSGGVQFSATPTYSDFGDDIDNMPKNMKELKKLDSWEVKLSGTFLTVTSAIIKQMFGAADIDSSDSTHVVPRNDLLQSDFGDAWWVGDYSDINEDGTGGASAGFIAIHVMNTLNNSGISIQSSDKAKGTMSFEYTGHYSMEDTSRVPCEVYIKAGTSETPGTLGALTVTSTAGTISGTTAIEVSPAKEAGNVYRYSTNSLTAPTVEYDDDLTTWTYWDGTSDITAADGDKITIAECTSTYKARKAGNTTVTAAD